MRTISKPCFAPEARKPAAVGGEKEDGATFDLRKGKSNRNEHPSKGKKENKIHYGKS